jgi:hypothetical protein
MKSKDKKRQSYGVVFFHIFVPSKVVIRQQPAERGTFAMFFEKYLLHL